MAHLSQGPVVAAVDVGSNSVKMTVARRLGDGNLEYLTGASETVRLGAGVASTGRLADDRIALALDTLRQFAGIAKAMGAVRLVGVATEASRRAENGPEFLDQVRAIGWDIKIISGDEEAAMTFRGLSLDVDMNGWVVAADIGGSSTEIIIADHGEVRFAQSYQSGSGTATERFVPSDPPTIEELRACSDGTITFVSDVPFPESNVVRLVVIGGTGEYLSQLVPDPELISASDIDKAIAVCHEMDSTSLAQRLGIQQARARVLPAGIAIVRGLSERIDPIAIVVSRSGIRTGLLLATFDELLAESG